MASPTKRPHETGVQMLRKYMNFKHHYFLVDTQNVRTETSKTRKAKIRNFGVSCVASMVLTVSISDSAPVESSAERVVSMPASWTGIATDDFCT